MLSTPEFAEKSVPKSEMNFEIPLEFSGNLNKTLFE